MKDLMVAIAEVVCAVISYAEVDSQNREHAVKMSFVRLGEAIEALDRG